MGGEAAGKLANMNNLTPEMTEALMSGEAAWKLPARKHLSSYPLPLDSMHDSLYCMISITVSNEIR